MRGSFVPLATFAIAVALSALTSSSRHMLRADGEATGCKVEATISGKVSSDTVQEGKDSIRDKGKEAVRKTFDQGFKKLKVDTNNAGLKSQLDDATTEIFEEGRDAYTVAYYTFGITSLTTTPTLWKVTGFFDAAVVILLPKDADETLTKHEEGHKLIAEKTVEYAKVKIKEAVEAAGCDRAAITAAFRAAAQKAYDIQAKANADYDEKTDHGRQGTAAGQLTQAAASFAAAVAGQ